MSLYGSHGHRKYLTVKERRTQFCVANQMKESDRKFFLLMPYYTGARVSEILQLEKWHIQTDEKCIVIESLKKRRVGYLGKSLY